MAIWKKSSLRTKPIGGAKHPKFQTSINLICKCNGLGYVDSHGYEEYLKLPMTWRRLCVCKFNDKNFQVPNF